MKMSMDNDEANREKELSSAPGVQTPDLIEEERPDPYPEGSPGSRDSSPGSRDSSPGSWDTSTHGSQATGRMVPLTFIKQPHSG